MLVGKSEKASEFEVGIRKRHRITRDLAASFKTPILSSASFCLSMISPPLQTPPAFASGQCNACLPISSRTSLSSKQFWRVALRQNEELRAV